MVLGRLRNRIGALDPVTGTAVALAAVALTAEHGLEGAATGVVTLLVWVALGAPYAAAVGQAALVVWFGIGTAPFEAPASQLAVVAVLAVDAAAGHDRRTRALGAVVVIVVTAGLAVAVQVLESPLVAGATVLGAAALAIYFLHRYELLVLGLVDGDTRGGSA